MVRSSTIRRSLAAVLLVQLGSIGVGSSPVNAQPAHPSFQLLSAPPEPSPGSCHVVLQDRWGLMWFGTQDGLYRYDGSVLKRFKHDPRDESSLSHNQVWALAEDTDGNILVGTDAGGLNRWSRNDETFTRFSHDAEVPGSLSSNRVRSLLVDRSGVLWVGTDQGLDRRDTLGSTSKRYTHDPEDPTSLSDNSVLSLYEDSQGHLWVGTRGGLNRFDPTANTFQRYPLASDELATPNPERVLAILEDHRERIWIGTYDGLYRYDRTSGTFHSYTHDPGNSSTISSNAVRALLEDRDRSLWIATDHGLNLLRDGTETFVHFRHDPVDRQSLSTDDVLSLYQDTGGVVWVGTLLGGITHFNPLSFSFGHYKRSPSDIDGLSSNRVLAFAEDAAGRVWIGTLGGGLNRWDRRGGRFEHFRHDAADPASLSDDRVTAVIVTDAGEVWAGTRRGGLNRFDPASGGFVRYRSDPERADSLSSDEVMSLYEDRGGGLWVGTFGGGLNLFDRETGGFLRFPYGTGSPDSLSGGRVTCLVEDAEGALWVGTRGDGLNRLDRSSNTFSHFTHDPQNKKSLSNNVVQALHVDATGRLWVGTNGGGLNLLVKPDPEAGTVQFRHYWESDGLPNDSVWGIRSDARGNLWISTNNGLAMFTPSASGTEEFVTYRALHGLQDNEFNVGAHYRSPRGELFFGGVDGFNAFFPERIARNDHPPKVLLTGFRRHNEPDLLEKPLYETDEISLTHQDTRVSFEYAALDYTAPHRNRYKYKLEGFDEDWAEIETARPATYTNLDPGDYTFRVKGSNSDGVWSVEDATVKVQVLPASWETWWAYCAYVLALIGSVLGLVVWRVDEHKRRSAELERTVARRTGELAELVERLRHSERKALKAREDALAERQKALAASNAKSMFLSNMSHELRTPLNAVLGFTKLLEQDSRLADDHREYLSIIGHSGEHLLGLIDEVLTLSKIEAGKLTLATRPFDPHRLVRGVEGMVRLRAESKGLQLTVDVDPELPACLRGDEGRLRQVLLNLLGNAVKFTRHGAIALHLRWRGGNLEFEVADTGQGIARDEIEHLFEPFEQTSAGRLSREGTGLGLTISRQLVQIMGGDIAVESEVDKGTTFRFAVPLEPADPTALPRARRQLRRLAPGQPPVEVLVVDDAAENRLLLRRLLSLAGFTVREAADGGEAVQQWQKHRPRLIWMDMQMPVMDGYQASRRIRELESDRGAERTPIIALTATAFEQDRGNILAAGCDDVLVKPFRVTDLFAVLTQHLDVRMEEGETKTPATEPAPAAAEPPRGGEAPPGAAPSPGGDRRPRILVTEADDANRKLVVRTLQALGHRAEVVADSSDALALFRRRPYDLVLLDAALPDGLETTRQLRRESTTGRELRIVGMTSHPRREERRRCLEAGMNDVLSKPVGLDDLKAFLDPAPAVEKAGDTAEAPPTEALDRERLASLRQLDAASQEALLSQLIALFLETAPAQVDDLRQAIGDGDGQLLRQLAHSLKNRSSNIGAVSMAAACEELEQIGRSRVAGEAGNPGQTEEVLGRLRVELDRATAALEREWEREARPRNS